MTQGVALLVGVKDASKGGIGCEHDVDSMAKILSSAGEYTINILKTELATASAVLTCIESAANTLVSGDMFVFYFSGHGSQKNTDVSLEEPDGQDETLCTYASEIVDNELAALWLKFAAGVRIVMLSDSCHSGTNYYFDPLEITLQNTIDPSEIEMKKFGWYVETAKMDSISATKIEKKKPIKFNVNESKMQAQLIHFGACEDDKESTGLLGGAFTLALVDVWKKHKGNFSGYEQLNDAITERLMKDGKSQKPQCTKYGIVKDEFQNSKPFSI